MKIRVLLILAALVVIKIALFSGKSNPTSGGSSDLIPASAEALSTSPEFKIEATSSEGLTFYVKELSPESVAALVPPDSEDLVILLARGVLVRIKNPFVAVVVRNGRIIDFGSRHHGLTADERKSVFGGLKEIGERRIASANRNSGLTIAVPTDLRHLLEAAQEEVPPPAVPLVDPQVDDTGDVR